MIVHRQNLVMGNYQKQDPRYIHFLIKWTKDEL